jgi:zinc protease
MFLFDPTAPLLHLNLGWKHGSDVEATPGLANLTAHALLRGTANRNRLQFEEHIERLGASIWPAVSADSLTLYATVPRDAWPEFAALLHEALTQPAFEAATLEELKDEVANQIKETLDSDRDLLGRAAMSALYGADHPYGRSELGTLESLDTITPEHLAAYHDTWLRSSNAVLALGGAFDAKARGDVAELLEARAGEVPETEPLAAPAPREGRTVLIVDKPERTQVQAMVLQPGARYQSEAFPAYLLGNDVLGGFSFQARLMKQVRVERGWSYYAYGFTRTKVHGGPYLAILAPGVEYATDAVALVIDLLGAADTDGVTQEELDQARSARVLGAPFLADTPAKRLDNLFDLYLRGYDEPAYITAMAEVTLEQANAAIAEVYDPDNAIVVLVATADDVIEGAEALGAVTVVPYADVQ